MVISLDKTSLKLWKDFKNFAICLHCKNACDHDIHVMFVLHICEICVRAQMQRHLAQSGQDPNNMVAPKEAPDIKGYNDYA